MVRIIDTSKTPFSDQIFIARIFDTDFVPNKRYAEILVDEIPKKKRMDIFYGIFHRLSEGDGSKLKIFFDAFFNKLIDDEKHIIYHEISECLKHENEIAMLNNIIKAFSTIWPYIEESARMRIENKLIKSIIEGNYHTLKDKCLRGAFGTWASNITEDFTLKKNLLSVLLSKLESPNRGEQDYVFKYFASRLDELTESPTYKLKKVIKNGLKNGDNRFKKMVEENFFWIGEEWKTPFKEDIENFKEKTLPFDPEYDDSDVPF